MKLAISTVALAAVLAAPLAFAGPHAGGGGGGMGGGMSSGPMGMAAHGPAPTSPSFTAPTNPNTRSGNATGHKGAPNGASCQSIGVYPGHASSSPGSPFNEPTATSAGGTAGQHYAGNVPQSQKNTASVSQYDIACLNAAAH